MTRPPLSTSAGVALGLASTAMPFARDPAAQVERWLRALGLRDETPGGQAPPAAGEDRLPVDPVAEVADRAELFAVRRGAEAVCPGDLLVGVMEVYGSTADRVLAAHGTTVEQLRTAIAHDQV